MNVKLKWRTQQERPVIYKTDRKNEANKMFIIAELHAREARASGAP